MYCVLSTFHPRGQQKDTMCVCVGTFIASSLCSYSPLPRDECFEHLSFSLSCFFFHSAKHFFSFFTAFAYFVRCSFFPHFLFVFLDSFSCACSCFSPHYSTFPPHYECSPDTVNLVGTLLLTLTVLKHNSSRQLK